MNPDPRSSSPTGAGRWESLFTDLEAQLAAAGVADARWDLAEMTRAERAGVGLGDRLRASPGARLRLVVAHGAPVEGVVTEAGAGWLLLDVGHGRRALVAVAGIRVVEGLDVRAAPPAGRVASALGLAHVLRALARDRVVATLRTDVGEVVGRLERVGADHVDVALESPPGRVATVPLDAVVAVVSR